MALMDMVYGGHSNSGLMAGLNDLKGCCHPKWFYGFVIPYFERRLMQSKNKSLWSTTEIYNICNIHDLRLFKGLTFISHKLEPKIQYN